ncbi:MAG: hypothetical protein D6689_16350 [Deltaproteobacteria bacterium]|nr:MAG: hypothetical protein D6689_16350 [Deltaproteobacteria bacterium]
MGMKPRQGRQPESPARAADVTAADPALWAPLTEGERADALRLVAEDGRAAGMVKVGRYRVAAVEPLALKPPHPRAGRRCARVVAYDYAAAARVDAGVDLDAGDVFHFATAAGQPPLAAAEEAAAIAVAAADPDVQAQLGLDDRPRAALQYWSRHPADRAYRARAAAVVFGPAGGAPSVVAVVDLADRQVTEVVPAERW